MKIIMSNYFIPISMNPNYASNNEIRATKTFLSLDIEFAEGLLSHDVSASSGETSINLLRIVFNDRRLGIFISQCTSETTTANNLPTRYEIPALWCNLISSMCVWNNCALSVISAIWITWTIFVWIVAMRCYQRGLFFVVGVSLSQCSKISVYYN